MLVGCGVMKCWLYWVCCFGWLVVLVVLLMLVVVVGGVVFVYE